MSPILRRQGDEYDPRKRRTAFIAHVHLQDNEHEREHEHEHEREQGNEQPLLSLDAGAGTTGNRHRSYGSEHSDDTLPERGKPLVVFDGGGGGEEESESERREWPRDVDSLEPDLEPPPPPIRTLRHPSSIHAAAAGPTYLKRTVIHLALTLAVQSTPALLLSLTGLVFTGQLLDHLAVWSVFRRVDELFILVPVLGNLKGNLEMCLGARLGTSANRGHLDTPTRRHLIITHAITFLLLQALTISSIAGVLSFLLGLALNHRVAPLSDSSPLPAAGGGGGGGGGIVDGPHREGYTPPGGKEFILVVGTGMAAATISSLILGTFISSLIIGCRWFGVDPDNIASPLAATLGDLLTLFIMALVGTVLVKTIHTPVPVVLVVFMCVGTAGIWWSLRVMASRREKARGCVRDGGVDDDDDEGGEGGWSPLIGAMLISSATGLVLDRSVNRYKGFAILAISITGIAGSIGAIHASRLSTALHAARKIRHHREQAETRASSPLLGPPSSSYAHSHIQTPHHVQPPSISGLPQHADAPVALTNVQSGITLFLISWPIQGVFVAFVWMSGWIQLGPLLTFWVGVVYGVIVALSIYVAQVMTLFFWSKNLDPDSYTLPVHSSLIDLFGQILLVIAFEVAARMGADVINVDGLR